MLSIWKIINKNKVVANEAKLPGINLILPIPNKVTNKLNPQLQRSHIYIGDPN